MRLDRHQFARLLATVAKVVESRNTIPILSTVRLIAGDGKIAATATDLDIEVTGSIDAEGEFSGCIDAKLLAGIVNKLSGDTVDLDIDGTTVTIKAGRSRFKLQTLPVDDFPTMDAGKFTAEFEADAAALFAPVAYAVSDEQTRIYLNGVYLEPVAVTATNGHKLSTVAFEALGDFAPVIVPTRTVEMAPKGDAAVRLSASKIQFQTDEVTITSRLIDSSFPDYQRVIPRNNERLVTFDGAALKAATERVRLVVTEDREPGVRLAIAVTEGGEGEITVSAASRGGEAVDFVPCSYEGEPMEIGFGSGYLVEVLSNLPAGEVTLALQDAGSPALFTSAAAEGHRTVLMPRRV